MVPLNLSLFSHNWQRKLMALIAGCLIWFLANKSISTTITVNNVPVKIVDLPANRAIKGMGEDGILSEKISLRISGKRNVLDQLHPRDLLIEVSAGDEPTRWEPKIGWHNLRSLDPYLDLNSISSVTASKLEVHQGPKQTARIPVSILPPYGDPPEGYHYIDIWPRTLYHSVSGPAESVEELKQQGTTLLLDLSQIQATDLDAIRNAIQQDEVSYFVPSRLRKVTIPFLRDSSQEINDPKAQSLRIDFLRSEALPIEAPIPVLLYFRPEDANDFSPSSVQLASSRAVVEEKGLFTLKVPVFSYNVSRHFLDVIENHLAIVVAPDTASGGYSWSLQVIGSDKLEELYVAAQTEEGRPYLDKHRGRYLRQRFRDYLNNFNLYMTNRQPLSLNIKREGNLIRLYGGPGE